MVIINHKSWVVHRPHPTEEGRTACPYVRKMGQRYENTEEEAGNLRMYQRCAPCLAHAQAIVLPTWNEEECAQPSSDESSSTGSFTSDSRTSLD